MSTRNTKSPGVFTTLSVVGVVAVLMAVALMVGGSLAYAGPQVGGEPSGAAYDPYFTVFPEWDYIEAWDWPVGEVVTATVDHSDPEAQDCTAVALSGPQEGGTGIVAQFELSGSCNIVPGDYIELTDDVVPKAHTVTGLAVTEIDPAADTVSGIAALGLEVRLWVHEDANIVTATTDISGNWTVTLPYDIQPGTGGRADQVDADGDATALDWYLPEEDTPKIFVSISNDYLRADNFSPGGTVTFRVYESQGSSKVVLVINREADETGHVFIDGWEHDADFVAGQYVVAIDGVHERQLVLEPLTIEVFDVDADFVSGTASPGRSVWVVIGNNTIGYPAGKWAVANAQGDWSADFASEFDITDDMWGSAVLYDEDGDETVFHKGPPPVPYIWADPRVEYINGWEWTPGTTVSMQLFDDTDTLLLTVDQEVRPDTGVGFDIWAESIDLQAGFRITMSDGETDKQLIVSTLDLTDINLDTRTVSGIYDPDPNLGFWINVAGQEPEDVTFDGEQWVVVFAELSPGAQGEVAQPDEDGDMTGTGIEVPARIFLPFTALQTGIQEHRWE